MNTKITDNIPDSLKDLEGIVPAHVPHAVWSSAYGGIEISLQDCSFTDVETSPNLTIFRKNHSGKKVAPISGFVIHCRPNSSANSLISVLSELAKILSDQLNSETP